MGTFLVSTAASSFAVLLLLLAHITAHFCISADSTIPSSSPPCIERERKALLEFKASLNDPSNWLSSWKGLHCCQWEGVVCHNSTAHVLKLLLKTPFQTCFSSLKSRNLYHNLEYEECVEFYGSRYYVEAADVNPSLLQLEYLTHLDLSGNDFNQSQIPTFIGSMHRLRYLSLSDAKFGGRIPNSLGKLKNLQFLDLSGNFYLEVSDDINWISALGSLEHLDMSGVYFGNNTDKLFQQLEHMKRLKYLSLSDAELRGRISDSLGSLTHLQFLDLSWNYHLTGRIPNSLGNLTNLQFLDLSWNNFDLETSDDINWISGLGSLEHLDMSGVFHSNNSHKLFQQVNLTGAPQLQVFILARNGLTVSDLYGLQNMTSSSLVHLDLSSNYLITSVPSWFANFEKLEFLDLSECGLQGPIPDALKNMTSIETLYLSRNEFDFVPSWFRKFEKIKYLDLSFNKFRGAIPDAIRHMPSVEFLVLSYNNFTSVPSWFPDLKTLLHLDLSSNQLTSMECSISSILTTMCHLKNLDLSHNKLQEKSIGRKELSACISYDLERLDLSDNKFSTHLPSWLEHQENLRYLYLQENLFYGLIPFSFKKLPKLEVLYLSNNKLEGPLPHSMRDLVSLIKLDLSHNSFDDSIFQTLGQLVNLKSLDLSNNLLNNLIFQSLAELVNLVSLDLSNNKLRVVNFEGLSQLINLKYVYLSNNQLHVITFQSIDQPVNLQLLDLSNNHLNDTIFQSVFQLVNLSYLDLSNNHLNDTIDQSVLQLVNLYHLNLSRNELHGSIPIEFGQLVNLEELDLSSNSLDGMITLGKNWSSVMPLSYLDLSNNQISGSLSVHIGHTMPNMRFLLLGNNHINGSIPNSLCEMELTNLDISNNTLSGVIPNCWKDTQIWEEINLSSNKLSGVFPSSIGNLSTLSWLHLNNNSLHGELPVYVENLKQLVIFDFGENKLSGNIPAWTAYTFPSLQVLRLRQNKLSGSIPSQLCQLSTLKILDLSRNNLQGSIPSCIDKLRGMTLNKSTTGSTPNISVAEPPVERWSTEDVKQVMKGMELDYTKNLVLVVNMDLSENKLVGIIPTGITSLNGLHGLNLSNNHLKGGIPEMIADMESLESFDVSNNQLSGTIPSSMPSLTSLSHLNLSRNNFSGPIPTGYQFSTYDQSSYVDNPYLCGLPLLKKCPGDNSAQGPMNRGFEDEDDKTRKLEKWLFYLVVAAGFATGFWGVIGVLFFKKSWRHAYFRWVEDIADKIYVATAVQVAKQRKRAAINPADG